MLTSIDIGFHVRRVIIKFYSEDPKLHLEPCREFGNLKRSPNTPRVTLEHLYDALDKAGFVLVGMQDGLKRMDSGRNLSKVRFVFVRENKDTDLNAEYCFNNLCTGKAWELDLSRPEDGLQMPDNDEHLKCCYYVPKQQMHHPLLLSIR